VTKIDYRTELKAYYQPSSRQIEVVDVPAMHFLMVDGEGDPNTSRSYQDAMEVLFTVSYTLKFTLKKGSLQIDYSVFPLEGLWWADDPSDFIAGNKDKWRWTSMIAQPELITTDLVEAAIEQAVKKKQLTALRLLRFEPYVEGKAAQIMYVGPFSGEGPTIGLIHSHIRGMGAEPAGKHHEIYLSDFRRTSPDKLKTIIRQPFKTIT
jgi:hypothetical protein